MTRNCQIMSFQKENLLKKHKLKGLMRVAYASGALCR